MTRAPREDRRRRAPLRPTFAFFEAQLDRPICDACGAPASWRGEVEGVTCDLCSDCKRAGVVP